MNSVLLNHYFIAIVILFLSLWTCYPLFQLKFGGLSGGQLLLAYQWEGVVLLIPLPGLIGSAYGYISGAKVRALLIGLVPYAPLLLLGYPLVGLFFIPGISNGLFGLASATLRMGERFVGRALILFIVALVPWLYLVASLFRYG